MTTEGDDVVPRTVTPLAMSDGARRRLEEITLLRTVPLQEVRRAQALLLAADGLGDLDIARRCGTTPRTVAAWRRLFREGGVDALRWARRGRVPPAELPAPLVRDLVRRRGPAGHDRGPGPAEVEAARRFPWLLGLAPDREAVEWRPLAVTALYRGCSGRAVAVAAPGAVPEPGAEERDAGADPSLLGFLKGLQARRPPAHEVHVVLNRAPSDLGPYQVDRWLSHPARAGLHLHLLPCPALWDALAAHWLGATCAALAPSSVQRLRQRHEQETP